MQRQNVTRLTQLGLAAALSLSANLALADINGAVFRDYDADGVRDTGEPGMGGITVTAYTASGAVAATATSFDQNCSAAATPVAACTAANTPALGSYNLVIASGGPFRVEFSGAGASFATAAYGSSSPSSVQFVATSSATNINAGFNNPAQYCAGPVPPAVVAGFFTFGNLAGITTLYGFDYDARGTNYDADPVTAGVQAQRRYGLSEQTGAVYGIAYQRRSNSLFASAYVHRGSPMGPTASTGTIYRSANVERGTTGINAAEFITVNGMIVGGTAIDTGANPHPVGTDWTTDAATYPVVGKRGLGDLEISEDGLTLYSMNLQQRELLVLPIGNTPTAPTAAQIVRVPVPVPASCSGAAPSAAAPSADDIRPFATKFFDGRLYIGMVCTAQSMRAAGATLAAAKAALRGYVYGFNPATNTFDAAPTFEFPLNYPRQFINNGIGTAATDGEWNPWNDTFQPADAPGSATFWLYPQPLITDLEFDAEGRMAIGIRDRLADQAFDSDDIGTAGNQNDSTRQGGDLLLACRNGPGGTWALENAGSCGTSATSDPNSTGAGTNVNSGPGNREFYWEEYYDFDFNPDYHRETAMGSLLWRPGSGNFMSTVYDVDAAFNGGVRVYSNTDGSNARLAGNVRHEFRVYEDGTSTFGKSGGIGDIELICEDPPVELGNRVWRDSNGNGRQDPGEPVFAGVVLNLYSAAGTLLGSATTDANGNFLFLFSIGATDANTADNLIVQPAPYGANVTVLVAPSNFNAGGPLAGFVPTVPNADATPDGTLRDSNGVPVTVAGGGPSGTGFVATVGQPGRNNHGIDFGFGIFDYGDLPDVAAGSGFGDYATRLADNGPSHGIVPGLRMGATVDGEADGQPNANADGDDTTGAPDDEDGVTVADLNLRVGTTPSVRVAATNTTGSAAQICGFIDFNGDGDFADAGETSSAVAVANGSNNVVFNVGFGTVPTGASPNTYARFRLSNTLGACSPVGSLPTGEVEDYRVAIVALDFGDLPDTGAGSGVGNYSTLESDNGPSHVLVPDLYLGASVDPETNGQPNAAANSDDTNGGPDDEDGVTVADLQFLSGAAATVRVDVVNLSGTGATLCGFVDFNADGDFADASESTSLPVANGVSSQVTLNFGTVPLTAVALNTYARFRFANGAAACTPNGPATSGEVEDYPAGVIPMDLGDLPDTSAGTGPGNYSTLIANNGPRHPRTANAPRLGATVDTEADGQPNATATGDGADEDGVNLASLQLRVGFNAVAAVTASNPGAAAAQVCGFVDFNGDGDFNDAGESAPPASVAAGSANLPVNINFGVVPAGAATQTYARFRISTDIVACTPDGAASNGEVEDYRIDIANTDLGDLPDTAAGTGPGNYSTLLADTGARHGIVASLRLGATVDGEADGQPNNPANGDDMNGVPDDEDGITLADLVLVGGTNATVRATATNLTGVAGQLCGFIDFNGDGDFADAGETAQIGVPNGSSDAPFALNFGTVPVNAVASTYARFRLYTGAAACSATGSIADGEVEDYPVSIGQVDFGDLPDSGPGSGANNYATVLADNGPRHPIVPGLFLGAIEDGEADGQPSATANGDGADEDGVTLADLNLTGGTNATIRGNVTNTTLNPAQLCGFVDFNGDGDFADAGETVSASVPTGSTNAPFSLNFGIVPLTTPAVSFARFRLSSDLGACSPVGAAPDGEVEDYPLGITQLDFGDLPDTAAGNSAGNYSTLLSDNGPRHVIVPELFLGAVEDAEADGQPGTGANGDDTNAAPDDEDGVNPADLTMTGGTSQNIRVTVSNTTGATAQLCGFVDFNADGDFADAGEAVSAVVNNGLSNAIVPLNFSVPLSAASSSYARFRLSTDAGPCSPVGAAGNGEVEDYPVSIGQLDFGDLPDTGTGSSAGNYATLLSDDGPRHPITSGLFLGATEDSEADGQPSVGANGDGADEDGVTLADLNLTAGTNATIRVNATNTTASAAQLCGFVDFNGDGDFADAGESNAAAVPVGSNNSQFSLNFGTVPGNAAAASYARFRLSSDTGACTANGAAPDGEVEDYPVGITRLDFGDLPDSGAGTGANNYATLLSDNGPRHTIIPTLQIGATVDAEGDGQPSVAANADDANGTPDDEDGVNTADLALQRGVAPAVRVTVSNTSGSAALLCGYLDYNADGDFADAGEAAQIAVPNGSTNTLLTLNFGAVPNNAAAASYARFRLSTGASCSPVGAAADGEVEDYPITTGAGVLSLGNLVWNDRNNNGQAEGGEPGLSGVAVSLYRDSDNNGTPDGPAIATTSTDGNGQYLFQTLDPDTYLVEIVAPAGYLGSTGSGLPPYQTTGSYEPAPDPDNDVNNDDNGTASGAVIRSGPVTLSVGGEPVNDGDADNNSNLSVDFGLLGNFDLALRKAVTAGQTGPFAVGQDVSFDITVFNQGGLPATTIVLNEYIPAGFALSPTETNWTPVNASLATRTIAGPLAPGANTTVTISLRIQPGAVSPLVNRAEIGSADDDGNVNTPPPTDVDSTPDSNPGNDAGGSPGTASDDSVGGNGTGTPGGTDPATDEDDADPAVITLAPAGTFDLALRKIVTAGQTGPFAIGQDVSFDITVFNQGSIPATTIVVNEYIPAGFALSPTETNWTPVNANLATRTIAGPLAPGASTTVTISLRIQPGAVSPLVNRAEIGSADDDGNTNTPPPTDVDSTPDSNPGNDAGGSPGTASDDSVGGNGTGTPGGTDPSTDEDDADPAVVTLAPAGTFDLALRKIVTAGQTGPFAIGQDVSFDITVFNQGGIPATTIVLNEYIPAGFALSPSETNWTPVNANLATRTIAGPLAAGANTTVTISLRIQPGAVSPLVNRAEIGSADDDGNTNTPPPTDVDSTPDSNPGNDAGGSPGTASDDSVGGNGTGTPGGTDPATDEDDADPAVVTLAPAGTFDLALRKIVTAGQTGPFAIGQDVSFDITVFNQGSIPATTIVLNEYIPAGFALSPTETNWTPVNANLATRTIAGPLAAGANTTVTISLRIQPGAVSPLINRAEIGSADDDGNVSTPPPTDVDSTPDSNPNNDAGGTPGTASDDSVNGNGTGTPGGTDPSTDEDDADPALVDIAPAGASPLGLAKAAQVLSIIDGGGYGDGGAPGTAHLAYVIVVRNYGAQAITNLQVVENLVTTFGSGGNWSIDGVSAPTLTLNGNYDGRTTTNLLSGTDVLAAGASTTIRLVVRVQFRAGQVFTNQVNGSGLIGGTPVSDLSNNGSDPAPGGDPSGNDTPTDVRLGMQRVPLLSPWSFGLLLLGLVVLAAAQRRRLAQRI